jgi:hypothetical protein
VTPEQRRLFNSLSPEQQVTVAILAAWPTCDNQEWREWAGEWLDESDRSLASVDRVLRSHPVNAQSAYSAIAAAHAFAIAISPAYFRRVTRNAAWAVWAATKADIDLDPILDAVAAGEVSRLIPA